MADYTTQIAALEAALAAGELTVESDGDRLTYRSTADLLAALNYFRGKAAEDTPTGSGIAPRRGSTLAIFDRNC